MGFFNLLSATGAWRDLKSGLRDHSPLPRRELKDLIFASYRQHLAAAAEALLLLVSVTLVDRIFFDGTAFKGVEPNPFWLVILILTWRYGTEVGVFSAIGAGTIFLLCRWPSAATESRLAEGGVDIWYIPLVWFITAVVLGELRQRERKRHADAVQKINDLSVEINKICIHAAEVDSRNKEVTAQLMAQVDMGHYAYRSIRQLRDASLENIDDWMRILVMQVLRPDHFSIYLKQRDGLVRCVAWGPTGNYVLCERYERGSEIYQLVVEQKRTLCVANENDVGLLANEAVLIAPICSMSAGHVVGMLKIESMSFAELNTHAVARCSIVCDWMGAALTELQAARSVIQISPSISIQKALSDVPLKQQLQLLDGLRKRIGFDVATIVIRPSLLDDVNREDRPMVGAALDEAIRQLRNTDFVVTRDDATGTYRIVLPKTSEAEARVVAQKLKSSVLERLPRRLQHIPIQVKISGLSDFAAEQARLPTVA